MTIGEALAEAARRLRAAGIDSPWREARLLVGIAAGVGPEVIVGHPERALPAEAAARLEPLLRRRCAGEPASRLAGRREFWSLPFLLSPDTLDPRPDSETVVEAALAALPDRRAPLALLDLGTGSGCLLLALLSELPAAVGVGVDASEGACRTARANAAALGLARRAAFVVADWAAPLGGQFDLVVSNPPYVSDAEMAALAPEVARFDPPRALAGGPDGLDAYRRLAPALAGLLRPGGLAVLEVGRGQAPAVAALLRAAALTVRAARRDLAGVERAVLAERAAKKECGPEKTVSNCHANH